jgi:hypothetical protein
VAGEYTWDQMPQELALRLKALTERLTPASIEQEAYDLQEWLLNEMQHCAATKEQWPRLVSFCPNLPEVGSEFCAEHLPRGDIDER